MRIIGAVLAILVWVVPAHADTLDRDVVPHQGRHLIALSVGILSDVATSNAVTRDGVSIEADGFGGEAALRYCYWFAEELALDASVGVVDADASVTSGLLESTTQAATVTRVLVGIKYQPLALAMGRVMRPYVAAAIGPYVGQTSGVSSSLMTTEIGSYSESAFGSRLGVGLDILVRNRVALGVEAGYGLAGDFGRPIGRETNYSSPEFLFSLGASLGGGQ
jgi:hypothetical protein